MTRSRAPNERGEMTNDRVQATAPLADGAVSARLGVIVVKFNRRMEDLPAMQSAVDLEQTADEWVVVDNSPVHDLEAETFANENNIIYRWMGGNRGISRAFNAGMRLLGPDITHVCFLDQDTAGITEFLRAAQPELTSGHDVWLPVVRTPKTILSPCRAIGPAFRPIKEANALPRSFSAINSGLIGRLPILGDLGFDESLFLDYVDHDLIRRARSKGVRFSLLNTVELSQDFSRETDDLNSAVARFKIFRTDVLEFYKGTPYTRWYPVLLSTWTALMLARQHRSIRALRDLLGAGS